MNWTNFIQMNKMKRFLLALLFFPLISYSQKNDIEQNALKWFKGVYVENTFKDPYSFKLLKINSIPQSIEKYYKNFKIKPLLTKVSEIDDYYADILTTESLDTNDVNTKIEFNSKMQNNPSTSDVTKEKYSVKVNSLYECKSYMTELLKIKVEKRKNIGAYIIYVDCYSNNSYGNKVLGKFAFVYYPISSPFYSSLSKYSYKIYSIDEETIIQLNN